jgi:hypothetical protein
MSKMIPDNVEQFTTEGERQTYRFLYAVAKPDAHFLFIGNHDNGKGGDSGQMSFFPDFFDFHGPHSISKQLLDLNAVIAYTADEIGRVVLAEGYPYSEIAVLYAIYRPDSEGVPLHDQLEEVLTARGIRSKWAAESHRSNRIYGITTNSMTISIIHSTKGFDYACVFLVGLDLLEEDGWSKEQITNMTYIAITRTRYQLFIPYVLENSLISKLNSCI